MTWIMLSFFLKLTAASKKKLQSGQDLKPDDNEKHDYLKKQFYMTNQ